MFGENCGFSNSNQFCWESNFRVVTLYITSNSQSNDNYLQIWQTFAILEFKDKSPNLYRKSGFLISWQMATKINFKYWQFRQRDAVNVLGYTSKDIIANFNFSLKISAKVIAQKSRTKVEFWNFELWASLFLNKTEILSAFSVSKKL